MPVPGHRETCPQVRPALGGIMTIRLNGSGSYDPFWLAMFGGSAVAGTGPHDR
jgi:hypothetical protein